VLRIDITEANKGNLRVTQSRHYKSLHTLMALLIFEHVT